MAGLVVDTDVVSFIFKGDTRAAGYHPHLAGVTPVITFQTLAELRRWALQHRWGATRIAGLEHYLQRYVIQDSNDDLCLRWAQVQVEAHRAGYTLAGADAWQAAAAIHLDVPLATHNRKDYRGVVSLQMISYAP